MVGRGRGGWVRKKRVGLTASPPATLQPKTHPHLRHPGGAVGREGGFKVFLRRGCGWDKGLVARQTKRALTVGCRPPLARRSSSSRGQTARPPPPDPVAASQSPMRASQPRIVLEPGGGGCVDPAVKPGAGAHGGSGRSFFFSQPAVLFPLFRGPPTRTWTRSDVSKGDSATQRGSDMVWMVG